MRRLFLVCLLIVASKQPLDCPSQKWGFDTGPSFSVSELDYGGFPTLADHPDSGRMADILWLEFSFKPNVRSGSSDCIIQGRWGIGEEGYPGNLGLEKQFRESDSLRSARSLSFRNVVRDTKNITVRHANAARNRWKSAINIRIDQPALLAINLNLDSTELRRIFGVSGNLIINKNGTIGYLGLPKLILFDDTLHVVQGEPGLLLDKIGIIPYRGLRFGDGKPLLKMVFDLNSVRMNANGVHSSSPTQ